MNESMDFHGMVNGVTDLRAEETKSRDLAESHASYEDNKHKRTVPICRPAK